jgi:hypothetical protein
VQAQRAFALGLSHLLAVAKTEMAQNFFPHHRASCSGDACQISLPHTDT